MKIFLASAMCFFLPLSASFASETSNQKINETKQIIKDYAILLQNRYSTLDRSDYENEYYYGHQTGYIVGQLEAYIHVGHLIE